MTVKNSIISYLWRKKSLLTLLLIPFSIIYWFLIILKYKSIKTSQHHIICIGNLNVGGSGKTPVAIAIAQLYHGKKIGFISRGYMPYKKNSDVIQVTKKDIFSYQIGDEPILLAQYYPTYVSNNKKKAIHQAIQDGIEVMIVDDGIQSNINRQYNILVVDEYIGFENHLLLPAGPLRDTLSNCASSIDCVIFIRQEHNKKLCTFLSKYFSPEQIINARCKVQNQPLLKSYVGFSGLAHNKKFFNTLLSLGIQLLKTYEFDDHYVYTDDVIDNIYKTAVYHQCGIITTEKDIVKISDKFRSKIEVLKIEIKFLPEDEIKLKKILQLS